MFSAGYGWKDVSVTHVNYGGDVETSVDYGGMDLPASVQNFGGDEGLLSQLLDVEVSGTSQVFGSGDEQTYLDPALMQKAAAFKADKKKFDDIIETMSDLYSFDNALSALPELEEYFELQPVTSGQGNTGPDTAAVARFLNPSCLATMPASSLVLGLQGITLEDPPRVIDAGNQDQVITPRHLINVFRFKNNYPANQRYYIRQNILAVLNVLAEFQRSMNGLCDAEPAGLIRKTQQARLDSSVKFQVSHEALNASVSESDQKLHAEELTRRTLAKLRNAQLDQHKAAVFESSGLQRPGNGVSLEIVHGMLEAGDENYPEKLSGLTLSQLADVVVEANPEWRLPFKAAIRDAISDYLEVPYEDISVAEIQETMRGVLAWAQGQSMVLPGIASILACIPSLGRDTMLEMDADTKDVKSIVLKHAQDPLLPSAIAKALKFRQANLENQVAGLIKNPSFYKSIYADGGDPSSALNLHGMYLLCSNQANRNMAFQTSAQFNHPDYDTRCSSGLYVNVNNPIRPQLECRQGEPARLLYIDKLWSLFRVIVMTELDKRLTARLSGDDVFRQEPDVEKKRALANAVLDRCAAETFGGAAGSLTGITRDILVNKAMQKAQALPQATNPLPKATRKLAADAVT